MVRGMVEHSKTCCATFFMCLYESQEPLIQKLLLVEVDPKKNHAFGFLVLIPFTFFIVWLFIADFIVLILFIVEACTVTNSS